MLVEPRDYRSFCFRGQGKANFVISARHRYTGVRIVWRFAKSRKSGMMTVKDHSELVISYRERIVEPFFDKKYLVDMSIVEFKTIDAHQLAKVPCFPANLKIENFENLFAIPDEKSFLPSLADKPEFLTSLQMVDATEVPRSVSDGNGKTVTVEIKPKQGFFQQHPNVDVSYCNNCILQIEKSCGSLHFAEMYDYCPLDLFSGCFHRMRHAIRSLFLVPHRNLRVFVDGDQVHSDEKPLDEKDFDQTFFPRNTATADELITAICLALSGNQSETNFQLKTTSVLGQILCAQQLDKLGIVRAHAIYERLKPEMQRILYDKTSSSRHGAISEKHEDGEEMKSLQQLREYFVAATMKDCSIMISLRVLPKNAPIISHTADIVRLRSGRLMGFSIKVVDLDPKTPKNLVNSYTRFMSGVELIRKREESAEKSTCDWNRCQTSRNL